MGTLLKWPVVRLVSSNYSKRQRLSWSKLLKQIQAAKVEAQNILRESEQEGANNVIGNLQPSVLSTVYAGTGYYVNFHMQPVMLPWVSGSLSTCVMETSGHPIGNPTSPVWNSAASGNRVTVMRRKQAPLRLIVAKTPKGTSVEEKLECGHTHQDWTFEMRGQKSPRRRRCRDCQQARPVPPKPKQLLQWTAGTAQYSMWIQRKTTVVI